MEKYKFNKPIFIVGAGRSGTTVLKKMLAHHPEIFATQFELNYLWRAGNAGLTHDQLDPEKHGTVMGRRYIRKTLHSMLVRSGKKRLVEKTVANVMRLPYLYRVFPEARVVHIIRDGRDVAASAMKRWQAHSGGGYLLKKAMTIPPFDLPRYGLRYAKNKLQRILGSGDHEASWGPRWPGMDIDTEGKPLAVICARQWVKSLEAVENVKSCFPKGQYLEIRYEGLINDTGKTLDALGDFLEFKTPPTEIWNYAKNNIRAQGKGWRETLSEEDLVLVMDEEDKMLEVLGYNDR